MRYLILALAVAMPVAGAAAAMPTTAPLFGGVVTTTKAHAFETLLTPQGVRVFLYTDELAPANVEKATGTAKLKLPDGRTLDLVLTAREPAAGEPTSYFCPMHPSVVRDGAGQVRTVRRHDPLRAGPPVRRGRPGRRRPEQGLGDDPRDRAARQREGSDFRTGLLDARQEGRQRDDGQQGRPHADATCAGASGRRPGGGGRGGRFAGRPGPGPLAAPRRARRGHRGRARGGARRRARCPIR